MPISDDLSELSSTLGQSSAAQAMPPPSTLQPSVSSVKPNEPTNSLPNNDTADVSMRSHGILFSSDISINYYNLHLMRLF